MVVHGTLHLLGYDHAELEEKELMWNLQKTILAELSIFPKKLPEE
jgi:probable rRNA maturation factor